MIGEQVILLSLLSLPLTLQWNSVSNMGIIPIATFVTDIYSGAAAHKRKRLVMNRSNR